MGKAASADIKRYKWLIIVLVIMVAGMGAAVGPITSGLGTGKMPTTVSQALIIGRPIIRTPVDNWLGTVNDTGTAFTAAANVNTGDMYTFTVPIANNSNEDMIAELTIEYPQGISVSVQEMAGSYVRNVTRTGANSWKLDVKASATLGTEDVHPALLVKIESLEEKLTILKGLTGVDFDLLLEDIKLGIWSLGAELDWFGLTDLLAMAEGLIIDALTLGGLTPGSPEALALIDEMLLDLGNMKAELPPGISGINIFVKVADNVLGFGKLQGILKQISY